MTTLKLAKLILLFQPEDSFGPFDNHHKSANVIQPVNKQSLVSLKALLWVVISIIAGIIISQL